MQSSSPQLAQAEALIGMGRYGEAALALGQLAARGDPDAIFTLAGMRWAGIGGPSNPALARDLYRRAEEAGQPLARHFNTNLLASGIAGPRDWPQALARLAEEARSDPGRRRALELVRAMALGDDGDPLALPAAEPLSDSPEVWKVPALLTLDECLYLRQLAEPHYRVSTVNDGRGGVVRDPIRTSDGATLHWLIEDPAIHAINRRLAAASGSHAECGEAMQILRYRPGEEYRPHLDAVRIVDNPRILTALVWLNREFEGGETRFTETGLAVRGEPGDALVFRNIREGRPDPMTRHAGLPVRTGAKYLASRWIRERRWAP